MRRQVLGCCVVGGRLIQSIVVADLGSRAWDTEKRQLRIAVSGLAAQPHDPLYGEWLPRPASLPTCVKTGGDDKRLSLSDFYSLLFPGDAANCVTLNMVIRFFTQKLEVGLSAPPVSLVKRGDGHGEEVAGDGLVVIYAHRDSNG